MLPELTVLVRELWRRFGKRMFAYFGPKSRATFAVILTMYSHFGGEEVTSKFEPLDRINI